MALRILIAILVLGSAGLFARNLDAHRASPSVLPDLARLPDVLDGWRSRDVELSEAVAEVLDGDVTLQRIYRREDGTEVHLFVAYFAEQAVNSQIHSPRHCVPGSGWQIAAMEPVTLGLPGGPQPATRMLIQRQGFNDEEMLYWFRTRSGSVTGEYALKWDLVKNALARRPTDAAFIRFAAPTQNSRATRELAASLDLPLRDILRTAGIR